MLRSTERQRAAVSATAPSTRCKARPKPAPQPARPQVEILQFAPEDPLLAIRPYTHTSNDWQLDFDTHKAIVDTFTEAGYPVPEMRTAQRAIQAAATSVANAGKA